MFSQFHLNFPFHFSASETLDVWPDVRNCEAVTEAEPRRAGLPNRAPRLPYRALLLPYSIDLGLLCVPLELYKFPYKTL